MPPLPVKIATAKKAVSRAEHEAAQQAQLAANHDAARTLPVASRSGPPPVAVGAERVARVIADFQSDTQEIVSQPDPLPARLTLFALALLVVAALTWAALATIDRIVIAKGKVISTQPTLVVQPLESAIIKAIHVRAGDVVKAGAVLAELDPTFSAADVAQLEARRDSLNAQIARLEAEYEGRAFVVPAGEPNLQVQLQDRIWSVRQSQFQAQMRQYEQKMAGLRSDLDSKRRQLVQLESQGRNADELMGMQQKLLQGPAGSRARVLDAERESLQVKQSLAATRSAIEQNEHELRSLEAEREVFVKQWATKISEDLVARRDERASAQEQLTKAQKRLSLVRLETPVDAVVLEVAPKSVGSVLDDAEPLFRLMPANTALEVEGQIEAKDVGHVRVGDPVEVKLDAYQFMEYGSLKGEVVTISEDSFQDKNAPPGQASGPVYKSRIKLVTTELPVVPDNYRLMPGMPAAAEIKVGERSVLRYFLRPVLRGVAEGLREP